MRDDTGEDPWGFLGKPKASEVTEPSPVAEEPSTDDPWSFLAARKAEVASRDSEVPVAEVGKREAGEFRAEMGGLSLRRRAWPMAMALAVLALAGYLTEVVASSQVLAMAGPGALVVIFPLGGISLLLLAVFQFRFIDHRARLPMIRVVSLGYAAAYVVVVVLLGFSLIPLIATSAAWLLADQLNFLMPLLIWSLASDEFNVAESRKIFPWVVTCSFGGQVLGLIVSAVSPVVMVRAGVPLTFLLVVPPIALVVVGLWLPRLLRHGHAAKGSAKDEGLAAAIGSAKDFVNGVAVWRPFLVASTLTFVAGATMYLVFLANAEGIVGSDAAYLQTLLGGAGVAWFLITWAIQSWGAERLQNRIGIPGALFVLPLALIVCGVLLVVGSATATLAVLLVGVSFWLVPRWSVDENARRSALTFVPDELRARVSFAVDLIPVAIGLIVSGPLAVFGIVTGAYWVIAVAAAVIAGLALLPLRAVRAGWEDSLLNWRLRRRKQNRTLDLG